jgi:hypothetical protein
MKVYQVHDNDYCDDCGRDAEPIGTFTTREAAELFATRYRQRNEHSDYLDIVEVEVFDEVPEVVRFYTASVHVGPDWNSFSAIRSGKILCRWGRKAHDVWDYEVPEFGISEPALSFDIRVTYSCTARAATQEEADQMLQAHLAEKFPEGLE